jgi:tRNA/rRNA methyltransferase
MADLSHIRIVLVEPAGALNVGSIARVMKNFGLRHLVLVNPACDPQGAEARQMAVHAADILEAAQQVTSLPEALQGCQRAIATTARPRTLETVLEQPESALPWLLETDSSQTATGALIFGPEERGLSNAELNYAQRFVQIPSSPEYPSLNLAQAVAVCVYVLCQATHPSSVTSSQPITLTTEAQSPNLASLDVLEGYYQHLESVLLNIGYLYPHTASSRMEKFRRLFNRAFLSAEDVAMLRGILSQVEWAMRPELSQNSDLEDNA